MAGQPIDEAYTAQRATLDKPPRIEQPPRSANPPFNAKVATSETKTATLPTTVPESLVIGGIIYYPGNQSQISNAYIAHSQPLAFITDSDDSGDSTSYSYYTYLAVNGPLTASLDWHHCSTSLPNCSINVSPVLSHVPQVLLTCTAECSFILDSGALNHISPKCLDFKTLRPIAPHSI